MSLEVVHAIELIDRLVAIPADMCTRILVSEHNERGHKERTILTRTVPTTTTTTAIKLMVVSLSHSYRLMNLSSYLRLEGNVTVHTLLLCP